MADHPSLRGELREREPMARHVSWRTGGSADRAYFPADLDDLRAFIAARPAAEPLYFVGLGSNLLVRDGGLRGTVVLTQNVLKALRREDGVIYAEAGVPSPKVARLAAAEGYAGAEFLAGIPGSVGGALAMNAGCYGGETWNIVETVTTIDRAGRLHRRSALDYEIGYRRVRLTTGGEEWFVAARFALPRGDAEKASMMIKQLLERRIASQPLDQPNAGSVFRNPPGDHAARLIEACGLKGRVSGGAMISDKHANFIVNRGGASAADIEVLVVLAENAVRDEFGIALEREVRIVGDPA
ncbi:MAG TPA: UDP-N-acetylmuramate dehydrogenase [Burkholderiales bacterium]|nr:UDP-N-acetylmuramate dehydrogenase [Burkholderiales bacterium]